MSSATPISVLFVCMGNICRSPAAEIIFRHKVEQAGLSSRFEIDSAGVIDMHTGSPPDRRMIAALQARNYVISGRARQIRPADLDTFDHILVMDHENLSDVRQLDPKKTSWSKIKLMTDYATQHDHTYVPDPYYGGTRDFEQVVELLEDACENLLITVGNDGGVRPLGGDA